ncbi:hypothetical protein L1987_01696 [Smallanthus sonchifolius]|uniref:Uncharacterized protein n=1 Tax=Smallanthus sonchifolius TaxID=185202 RepID=A0ACB9K5S3_9ASTR|nr:hypothetical protein L1987_01696 [Smallanthus sonchifolius]
MLLQFVLHLQFKVLVLSVVDVLKTTNGGEGYACSAHSEEIKQNQALMADVNGKESSEKVASVKVDSDEIALYKRHNQILVDELNKALEINSDLKEVEKVFNEKIEALTNDLAVMTYIKNVLEIQQEDLLVHIKVKSGLGYHTVPHPFNGNFTFSPEHNVNVNHLPDFPLSADPILSTGRSEEETGSEDERAESIKNVSFHVDVKISDESKESSSPQNVKTRQKKKKLIFYVRSASHPKSQQFSKGNNSQYTSRSPERNAHQHCYHTSSSKMNQRFVSPRKLKACFFCHDLYHIAYDCSYNPMHCNPKKPVHRREGKEKMRNPNDFPKRISSFYSQPKCEPVFVKPKHVWAKRHDTKTFATVDGASSSSSNFIEEDDFRVEISSSILDPLTIEHVPAVFEVSEASSSHSTDVSAEDSNVEEPISPISSNASELPKCYWYYSGSMNHLIFNPTEINGQSARYDHIIPNHFMSLGRR